MEYTKVSKVNSKAEDLFITLFCEVFGPHNADKLYVQYPFVDIYGGHRFIDFALENEEMKIAIEIDGETYHNPKKVSENKYFDDLLKQNSLIYDNWRLFRWAYNQLAKYPEKVKDELLTFIGDTPFFMSIMNNNMPKQKGQAFELKEHQKEALDNLAKMRDNGESIALLYHATGTGKTVTAVMDAKRLGGRTLFLVNALKLADQAEKHFKNLWPEATTGKYIGEQKDKDAQIILATVQTLNHSLSDFKKDAFDYIIIDECHHSTANTYKKIFSYFKPKFILGLSATPKRMDGKNLLELFKNIAHKMDLKTAVEKNELVPIRCIRVKTDIDLTNVRINGIKYNSQDLESRLFVPERNNLIASTYINYVKGKKTVIFCASVDHAVEIAKLLRDEGVNAESVSGYLSVERRNNVLKNYEIGNIDVLCACDILNEGWDSPKTEVLFMARPTMSKTIYMQQLGRGTRKSENKECLLVFDFVDNVNMFNAPYSMHRLLNINEYKPGQYVLAPIKAKIFDNDLFYKGEKPEVIIDMPLDINDFEIIDLFNWQEQAEDMISEIEFVRMVDVQSETISKYIKDGKIKPDLSVPISESKKFNYFYEETIKMYAKKYKWDIITPSNIKDKFINFINKMDMSYSYKPVLLKAIFEKVNNEGEIKISDIVDYFISFYCDRKNKGLVVEKKPCLYLQNEYSRKDVEKNIFANPFKRFADMRFLKRCNDFQHIKINNNIFKKLSLEEIESIIKQCDIKLKAYYEE